MASSFLDLEAGLPLHAAARRMGVTRATVNGWVARGRVAVVGTHWRWGKLYRLGDLIEAEKATRESPRSHRKPVTVAG